MKREPAEGMYDDAQVSRAPAIVGVVIRERCLLHHRTKDAENRIETGRAIPVLAPTQRRHDAAREPIVLHREDLAVRAVLGAGAAGGSRGMIPAGDDGAIRQRVPLVLIE